MNCREVHHLFVAYLDHEVGPSEHTLIESHLAGCEGCRQDLSALRQTRTRLTASLTAQAAQAIPSPLALDRLQAGIAEDAPALHRAVGTRGSVRNMRTRWKVACGLAAAAVLATSAGFAVPSARAGAGDVVSGVLVIIMGSSSAVGSADSLQPPGMSELPEGATVLAMQPTYLPEGFGVTYGSASRSAPVAGGQDAIPETQNVYQNGDDVLVITTKAATGAPLPDGTATGVNGHPAVLSTGLAGAVETPVPPPPASASGAEGGALHQVNGAPADMAPITYANANKITWDDGATRIEVLSTLSVDEVRKVAEGFKLTM